MKNLTTRKLLRAAVIAALYAALTLAFAPISYGPFQFRISEALAILPLFCPEAVIGLTIGCFIANTLSAYPWDVVFGTLATLCAATLTCLIGKGMKKDWRVAVGIIPPITVNAFVVPFLFLAAIELKELYLISVLQVGGGQAAVLVALGIPLYFALKRVSDKIFS
ncbi:MAG: QueT transporter family protein [Firmicutes bacterium]|nr:QueT transporter family protein [Bacillota bacterium]